MTTKTISRKAKGAIAAVAGGALLLGTGATFALWSATATTPGAEIQTGNLSLGEAADLEWEYYSHDEEWEAVTDPILSPGITVQGATSISHALAGTDLKAKLEVGGGALDGAFAEQFVVTWYLNGTPVGTGPEVILSESGTSDVAVRIYWDSRKNDNDGRLSEISLTGATVTLTQVLPPVPTS